MHLIEKVDGMDCVMEREKEEYRRKREVHQLKVSEQYARVMLTSCISGI